MSATPTHVDHSGHGGVLLYTVISKAGQRGIEFEDPGLAAEAFVKARNEDKPFVLRHRGSATTVIAFAKAGRKQMAPGCAGEAGFRREFEAIASDALSTEECSVADSHLRR